MAQKINGKWLNRLTGIKKLNRVVKKALEPFGIDNTYLWEDFEYRFENNAVGFSLATVSTDEWFNEFVEKTFNYTVTNTFIISVLHEIGHAETENFITDEIYNKCIIEKIKINKALETENNLKKIKALEFKYFDLPDEYEATAWAVEYAREHEQELAEMWQEICKGLQEFYTENNLTEKTA